MHFYVLPKVGTGEINDPCRPNVPDEINYVCDGIQGDLFLVGTSTPLPLGVEITQSQVENYCSVNKLNSSEVLNRWYAGGD